MSGALNYLIPYETAQSEFVEKKSRFISHIWRVESEEEARARIEEMRKTYHDARHNCWCYLLHEGALLRYSDDGEPQGTAGQPMLNVFQRREVWNVCCVVTRYFGGVLLGTGGLTRAYSRGASDALEAAGLCRMCLWERAELILPYALFEQVKLLVAGVDGVVEHTEYGAQIVMRLALPQGGRDALQTQLTELSAGALQLQPLGERFQPGPREETTQQR